MAPILSAFWSVLAIGGLALAFVSEETQARQPAKDDLPKSPPNILGFREAPPDLKKAKDAFSAFAKYNAEYIANPRVYSTPQEFVPPRTGVPVQTVEQLISELNRHILVPLPDSRINVDNADYIRELGLALDTELKAVIEQNPTPIVKMNAMRMLAAACRSGATAHYPTITEFIKNPNTSPEVKYYAFQAAGNLLAAYDLNDYGTRGHSNKPKEVSDLIAALQNAIVNPNAILPAPADNAPRSPEQNDVLTFIRRQAVKALGEVRFSEKVQNGPYLYPAFTLAQVATSDPAIVPPPTETEIAEAVIGICNMAPPAKPADKEPYAYAMTEAVATGLVAFATRRAASQQDKSLAWRSYGARLSDAMKGWRALFDPLFNPAKPAVYSPASVPKPVAELVPEADSRILVPMYDNAGVVNVNLLRQYRDNTIRGDKKWRLDPFASNPKLMLIKGK
ncbi:MAG TPA: hypothetical protein VGL71_03960 [Urbifossiella sp.]|jgi:hypothetical protein